MQNISYRSGRNIRVADVAVQISTPCILHGNGQVVVCEECFPEPDDMRMYLQEPQCQAVTVLPRHDITHAKAVSTEVAHATSMSQ
jgi:hypothetical protein